MKAQWNSALRLPLLLLEHSWRGVSRWDAAIEGIHMMSKEQLEQPKRQTHVLIDQLGHTGKGQLSIRKTRRKRVVDETGAAHF